MNLGEVYSDPVTKKKVYWHEDPITGAITLETVVDVENLIDYNKARYNSTDERANWKGDHHLVASIPMALYWDLVRQGIAQDSKALLRWLDNPDNKHFRVRPGRLSR